MEDQEVDVEEVEIEEDCTLYQIGQTPTPLEEFSCESALHEPTSGRSALERSRSLARAIRKARQILPDELREIGPTPVLWLENVWPQALL